MSMIPIQHWTEADRIPGHLSYDSALPGGRRYAVRHRSALCSLSAASIYLGGAKRRTAALRAGEATDFQNPKIGEMMRAERRACAHRAVACALVAAICLRAGFLC